MILSLLLPIVSRTTLYITNCIHHITLHSPRLIYHISVASPIVIFSPIIIVCTIINLSIYWTRINLSYWPVAHCHRWRHIFFVQLSYSTPLLFCVLHTQQIRANPYPFSIHFEIHLVIYYHLFIHVFCCHNYYYYLLCILSQLE